MANSKITWNDKESLVTDPTIAEINKVTDDNMNEIKNVVNENADQLILSDTEPTSNDNELWVDTSSNATYMNQEVNIGATNPNNTPTWFKMSKNLFGAIPPTETKNGITLTNNGDGTFNLVGTATAQTEFIWWKDTATLGFLYTGNKWGSYVSSSNNNVIYQISTWNGTPSSPVWVSTPIQFSQSQINKSITASNFGVLTRFNIQINNGTTVNLTNIKVSLEATENEVTYNKYLGYSSIVINGEELYNKPVELYNNTSGTTGNVTLSDSKDNYRFIEIFYKDDQNYASSIKIKGSDTGFIVQYNKVGINQDRIYLYDTRYTIDNNVITVGISLTLLLQTSGISVNGTTNLIYITKVIGYK